MATYYEMTEEVSSMLEGAGKSAEARILIDTIRAGFTATEILSGVRWHLRRILEANPDLAPHIRTRMTSLAEMLDGAF